MANGYTKESLTCQSKKHFVVIRKNKSLSLKKLKEFLNSHYSEWALIVHEKDIDPETGLIIPIHFHYVGNYLKSKTPFLTTLNEIRDYFGFDNNDGLQIDKYIHLESCLQYLLHKNNPEKTSHDFSEIHFGGWTKEELTTFITAESNGLNFDRVLGICKNYESIIDVIREIGFSNYARYRNVIMDIFNDCCKIRLVNKEKEEQHLHKQLIKNLC